MRNTVGKDEIIDSFNLSDVTDWKYLNEGGLNITLSYVGSNPTLIGRVMRFRKSKHFDDSMGQNYREKIIRPLIGKKYVEKCIKVNLPAQFRSRIKQSIYEDRPTERKKKPPTNTNPMDKKTQNTFALLMTNNTLISNYDTSVPNICIEIKPKCGFLSRKQKENDLPSRFQMHQKLKLKHKKIKRISDYDPLDLFSQDEVRMKKSIRDLAGNPQNNLRLFIDGKLINPNEHQKFFKSFFNENYVDLIVLKKEKLLQRILAAQKLDYFGIEKVADIFASIQNGFEEKYTDMQKKFENKDFILKIDYERYKVKIKKMQHCLEYISFTDQEKLFLIRDFMISKTMKDCSIMLAFKQLGASCQENLVSGFNYSGPCSVSRKVLEDSYEFIEYKNMVEDYRYFLNVVDLDEKNYAKIPEYLKQEQEIENEYYNSSS
eukprot:snap_masked-scaffold_6-processed-gene-4.32-mRNA-1 protein AED:1.00 eAED:1.00 QI:0/0/0/0/1/1/2/0/430